MLQTTLEQPVLSHPDTGEREAQIFSCLGPQVAESVSFSILVAGMEEEIETKLSEDEKSCVREAFADTDVPALITAPDGSADAAELGIAMLSCAPAQFLSSALGVDVELSEDEAACLRESLAGIDAAALMADDDSAASAELGMAMLSCVPGQILSTVIGEDVELSEDEASCLRELVANTDVAALVVADEDSAAYLRFGAGLLVCVPDLFITGGEGDAGAASDDDHANSGGEAIAVTVGRSA